MIEAIFFNPWIWIVAGILVALLALTIVGIIFVRRDEYSIMGPVGIVVGGISFLMLGAAYFGWILPPYDTSFYQTYRITGEVTSVESAFNGEEGTMSQVFVAEVEGVDLYIRSNDQRFRTLDEGDDVNLVCTKGFAYFQQPWYDCNFGGN